MTDLYEHLARQQAQRDRAWGGGTNMVAQSVGQRVPGLAPVPGLAADEISHLLVGREDRGRQDGYQAGYESGSMDARRHAEHAERGHFEVVLNMLRVEMRAVAGPLGHAVELLETAEAARAQAKTPKERALVKAALGEAREAAGRANARLAELEGRAVPALVRRVLEDGLPL